MKYKYGLYKVVMEESLMTWKVIYSVVKRKKWVKAAGLMTSKYFNIIKGKIWAKRQYYFIKFCLKEEENSKYTLRKKKSLKSYMPKYQQWLHGKDFKQFLFSSFYLLVLFNFSLINIS